MFKEYVVKEKNSSKYWLLLPVLMLMLYAAEAAAVAVQSVNNESVSDRIIVKYKLNNRFNAASAKGLDIASQAAKKSGQAMVYFRRMNSGAHILKLKKFERVSVLQEVVNKIQSDAAVEYAEVDLMLHPMAVPNDTRYNEQWHYFEATAGMRMPAAWDITQGAGSVVAVLDTGYRPHVDLVANILQGYDMISSSTVAQDGNGRDPDALDEGDWAPAGACYSGSPASNSSWHGTHVAGSVAAVGNNGAGVTGTAYKAKIVPVRVLGRCGGYTSDIADGIIWAAGGNVSGVNANANPADVINLSLGGSGSCSITQQNAIDIARNLGATVVVAAGNANVNASNSTPANCSGVVTVAAVNRQGGKAYYSNYGSVVDIAAPGGDTRYSPADGVLSTLNSGTSGPGTDVYSFYQGTSMATPHVAGVAALLYAVKPSITPDEVESTLVATSRGFSATCLQCGSGIVNAYAAVNSLSAANPPPASNVLQNNIAITGLSGGTGTELRYTFDVPANATNLNFVISGGTGDADLYIKYGSAPTTSNFDCRPYLNGNEESCDISAIQAGTYHVMVRAYSTFSGLSLVASYIEQLPVNGIDVLNLSDAKGGWKHYSLQVPAGVTGLSATISGGTGDADLYVRYGAEATTTSYNCRPYITGNNESCSFSSPAAGTWYISVRAYSSYSGVYLNANIE